MFCTKVYRFVCYPFGSKFDTASLTPDPRRVFRVMAPPVAFVPEATCSNFPLCKGACVRSRVDGKRIRLDHCTKCNVAAPCKHPGCAGRAAPEAKQWKSYGLCAPHLSDPCYFEQRAWAMCQNHYKVGCRQLTLERGGGKCHACFNGSLPCVNACLGSFIARFGNELSYHCAAFLVIECM